jgi:predicted outer membrane lipoprotein
MYKSWKTFALYRFLGTLAICTIGYGLVYGLPANRIVQLLIYGTYFSAGIWALWFVVQRSFEIVCTRAKLLPTKSSNLVAASFLTEFVCFCIFLVVSFAMKFGGDGASGDTSVSVYGANGVTLLYKGSLTLEGYRNAVASLGWSFLFGMMLASFGIMNAIWYVRSDKGTKE